MTPKSLKKRRVLRGSSGVQSADCRTWTRGALPREFEFSYFVSLPYVVVPIKGPTGRISFGSKARALLSPANARTRRCACGGPPPPAERRVRASLLCHPPLPAPASRAAHPTACAGLCGAQKTVGCPARGRGGRSGSVGPQRHARGVFSPRDTPSPVHARPSQLHMAHPAPHTTLPERHARRPDARGTSVGLRCAFFAPS